MPISVGSRLRILTPFDILRCHAAAADERDGWQGLVGSYVFGLYLASAGKLWGVIGVEGYVGFEFVVFQVLVCRGLGVLRRRRDLALIVLILELQS